MAKKPISTPNVTMGNPMTNEQIQEQNARMGRHGRIHEAEAERAKGVTFEPSPKQEATMARPKSDQQNARHEEDALREKAVMESRQKEMDRPENRASKEAMDRGKPANPAEQGDLASPGSPTSRTDHTKQFKIDEDRSVNASDKEAAQHHARHHKTDPDQKPTAESNLSDHLRNAMPEPKDEIPADKRMHISDELAAAISNRFAHNEIRYTNSGIDVLAGGEVISIDKAKIGKFETREDLRAYIDSLPVIRHG